MNDLRAQLPECPLEYEVPDIPGTHTALVIAIDAAEIDWQERMLPWTLASLINNTDMVMAGVHLCVSCDVGTKDRIQTALKRFDLPDKTIIEMDFDSKPPLPYDSVNMFNINYWAFRDGKNQIKLPVEHVLKSDAHATSESGYAFSKKPQLCNMRHATTDMFREAIKHLMGSQFAMKV